MNEIIQDMSNFGTAIIFVAFFTLPWILASCSKRVSGNQKLLWVLMSMFLSYFGYYLYPLLFLSENRSHLRK